MSDCVIFVCFIELSDEEDEPISKSRKRKRPKLDSLSDDDFPVPIKVETELYEEDDYDDEEDSNSDQFSIEEEEEEILSPVKKRQKRSPKKRADSSSKTVYPCTVCSLVFKSKIALGVHRKRSHGVAKKSGEDKDDDEETTEAAAATPSSITLDCEICNKTMTLNLIYTHHILPATVIHQWRYMHICKKTSFTSQSTRYPCIVKKLREGYFLQWKNNIYSIFLS